MNNFYNKRSPVNFTLNRWLHITIVLFFIKNYTDKRATKKQFFLFNKMLKAGVHVT